VLYLRRMNENEFDITKCKQAEKTLQNEEWLRLAIQAGKMYAYEWDITTDVLVRSPEYVNVLGANEPRILSHQQAMEKIHPDDRANLIAAVARHSPESPTVDVAYRVLLDGQSPIWVKSSGRAFFDEERRMLRVVGIVADITEHKLAEEALRGSEERLRLAQKVAGIGTFERNIRTGVNTWTAEMESMYGLPPGGFGRTRSAFEKLIHPDDRVKVITLVDEALKTRQPTSGEWRVIWPDGSVRWIAGRWQAITDDSGEPSRVVGVNMDVTDRKRTEQALCESEERLRLAAQAGRMYAFSWDVVTDVIERSGESAEIVGVEPESLAARSAAVFAMVYPADKARLAAALTKLAFESPHLQITHRMIRPDGSVIWVERNLRAYFDERGKIKRIVGMVIDITERKRAEEAIIESERRFRLVADTAPVMIWMSDLHKRPTYFNRPWLDFTGRSETDLQNGLAALVHPDDYQKCHEVYSRGFDQRQPFRKECRLRRHDGQYRWMLDVGVPRFQQDGSFAGYIGSCVDITEQKQAEEALSSISRRLIEAQEQERTWIAREMHDDINQRLCIVAMELDRQSQNLEASADELRRSMAQVYKQISELSSDIHSMSHRLHSLKLDSLGLAAAAKSFCSELAQRQDIEVKFSSERVPRKLPHAISLCLFRVLQEALQNAVKHSGVRYFRVSLVGSTDQIALTVYDEGRGFRPDEVLPKGGLGLTSMNERLKLVGGKFEIDAKLSRGTIIRASIPLKPQAKFAGAGI
jgi:PAS domain S-box-containing protein